MLDSARGTFESKQAASSDGGQGLAFWVRLWAGSLDLGSLFGVVFVSMWNAGHTWSLPTQIIEHNQK